MNKDIYIKAVDDINVDQSFVNATISKIANDVTRKKKVSVYRYISITACMILVIFSIPIYNKIHSAVQNKMINKATAVNQLDNNPLPEIKNNYVAFDATEYNPSKKLDAPEFPVKYKQLKDKSNAIIMCTIKKIGVYKKITDRYNFKADFGNYIYTIHIDKILSGNISNKAGDLIPISEIAIAWPTLNGDKIVKWNFSAYSCRPKEVRDLKTETQYVMFLSNKDNTGCYKLSSCGFGVFPIDYINKLSQDYTLKEIENSGKEDYPLANDYLFKVCSLHMKEDFLK